MYFCKCGADEYICQECASIHCSKEEPSKWVFIPRTGREGNMCPKCVQREAEALHRMLMDSLKRGGGAGRANLERYVELWGDKLEAPQY